MTMSRIKLVLGILAITGAAILILLQYQTQQKLRAENESLRQQIAQLKNDSQPAPVASEKPSGEDLNELLRLRGQVSALRSQTNQIARLQQQNQQLKDSLATATQTQQQSAAQAEEQRAQERAYGIVQINTAKMSVLGMILYANDNADQFPTNFNVASAYLATPAVSTNLDKFEIVYRGPMSNLANPASAIVVRSIQPWTSNGKWAKAYGFADAHAEVHTDPNGNFDEWEQQHAPVLKSQ